MSLEEDSILQEILAKKKKKKKGKENLLGETWQAQVIHTIFLVIFICFYSKLRS